MQLLEEIDDDLDEMGIMFVKIDDEKEAEEYGIEKFPTIGTVLHQLYKNATTENWRINELDSYIICIYLPIETSAQQMYVHM